LIVAQALKGVGGAMLVPGSLAIISAAFDETQRGRAIGTWSAFTSITMALGPVLGGWLVEHVSWRAALMINLPLAVIVLALAAWRVPESRDAQAAGQRLDWGGALLAVLGIGGITYGLTAASWVGLGHPQALGPLAAGLFMLAAFVWLESRLAAPMMPLGLFRPSTFRGTNLLTLLVYGALGGALFYFPFNLIQVQGYPPTAAGAALLPFILILFLLSRWSGGLVERYGARRPLILGPLIVAAGFALFAVPGVGGAYWTTFFPAVAVLGLGMALTVAPLTTAVMNSVETHQAGVASGINNAVARTAGLLGIAIMSIMISTVFSAALDQRLAALDLSPGAHALVDAQRANLAGAQVALEADAETQAALERAFKEAYVAGFRVVMLFAAGLALAGAGAAGALVEGKPRFDTQPAWRYNSKEIEPN
jgi:MFS family permease